MMIIRGGHITETERSAIDCFPVRLSISPEVHRTHLTVNSRGHPTLFIHLAEGEGLSDAPRATLDALHGYGQLTIMIVKCSSSKSSDGLFILMTLMAGQDDLRNYILGVDFQVGNIDTIM